MKKVLSILLSMVMLATCFVALIPTANAAVKTPERFPDAKKASVIYEQDFEGEAIVSSTNAATLFAALGWGGTAGNIALVQDTDSENHRMQITGATESMIVCKNDALRGGGYIVEYTAIMTKINPTADSAGNPVDGSGMGFRSSYKIEEAGWNFLAKERGNFDFHFHTADIAAGNYHSELDIATETVQVEGSVDRTRGSIINQEIRFRLVIDPVNGLSAYTVDMETGEATIVVGMNADKVASWADSAKTLNDELILRTIDAKTEYLIDDIGVYEADTNSYVVPAFEGYQTTELTGDTYGIRFLAKMEKKTDAINVGYKVEYRYTDAEGMVHKGTKNLACNYLYSSVTANGETLSYKDFAVIALHIENVPTAYDITYTVTPFVTFWSDFGCEQIYVYGESHGFIVNIPD